MILVGGEEVGRRREKRRGGKREGERERGGKGGKVKRIEYC